MPRKILNRFGIDTGIQQIRDVGVPELMGSDIKIDAVYDLGIILLMTAQFGIDHALDLLTVDVLVVSSFFTLFVSKGCCTSVFDGGTVYDQCSGIL